MFLTLSDVLTAKSLATTRATALLTWVQCAKSVAKVITTILPVNAKTKHSVSIAAKITCQDQVTVMFLKKEKEVMKIKVTQRLTYPEARKIYDQQKPEFTFSKVVSSMPKKPETKTSPTQYSVKDTEIKESSKVIISRIHNKSKTFKTIKLQQVNRRQRQHKNNKIKRTQIQNNQNKKSYRIG